MRSGEKKEKGCWPIESIYVLVVSKIIRLPRSSSAANFLCKETSWQPDYFAHPKY